MALLAGIRTQIGNKKLARLKPVNRQRKGNNLGEVRSLGFVFYDESEDHLKAVKEVVRNVVGMHGIRKVQAMAYVPKPSKQVPIYQARKLEFTYFDQDDLGPFFQPGGETKAWCTEPFDVLIDLTEGQHLPLQYLVFQSCAAMKVGRASAPRAQDYDLTLHVPNEQGMHDFMKQVNHYLTQFTFV